MISARRLGKCPVVSILVLCAVVTSYSLWMCNRVVRSLPEKSANFQENSPETRFDSGPTPVKLEPQHEFVPEDIRQDFVQPNVIESNARDVQAIQIPPSDLELNEEQPLLTKMPRSVFYLWCGLNPDFVLPNYLSLQSAVKFLQPQSISFLYTKTPGVDKHFYNTWLDEFIEDYPYIEMKELTGASNHFSCSSTDNTFKFIADYLREGGIFLGTNTVLTKPALHLWNETFLCDLADVRQGIIVSAPHEGLQPLSNYRKNGIGCQQMADLQTPVSSICLNVKLDTKPKDFWQVESEMGRLFNFLMYGVEHTPEPQMNSEIVIPNVAHMLWLNGKPINFLFYLSALSLLYIVKVDTLYIHGTLEPERKAYWGLLMEEKRIKYIHVIKPNKMFDQQTNSPHHMSDVFRAQIMDRYGGIYSDVDAIWTQPLSDELRRYDAVAALDWAHNYLYYPDYINLGVSIGRKGAPFWKHFLKSFKIIKDDVFGFNGLLQPYKIYERHPGTLKIQRNLQVMCFRKDCFPAWTKDWHSINWKTETYAFHWTYPDPPEFKSQEALMRNNTVWADIGKYVLQKAGKL